MSEYNVTRTENLLSSVASGNPSGIDPITREEMFLSYIAGESDTKPKPITRKEKLLDKIGASGTGGGAKPEQEKTVEITENGTTDVLPDAGYALSKVTVNTSVAAGGEPGKPYIDTSKITNFYYFCCNNRMNVYLDKLDTSNGTVFTYMFDGCQLLGTIPQIDTSRGIEFDRMLNGCTALETVPQLDTSNGSGFTGMFANCAKLRTIPPLDTSKGVRFGYMFSSCTMLETVSLTTAKRDLETSTFQSCTALKNLTIGEGWAVNIYLHYSNNLTVESLHGMIENLADLTGKTAKTFQIGATNLAKIDEAHMTMLESKNWNYS